MFIRTALLGGACLFLLSPVFARQKDNQISSAFAADTFQGTVVDVSLGVSLPRPIYSPSPDYPAILKGKRRIRGVCVVGLIVDEHGRVHDLHVTQSLDPRLDQSAIDAVKQWRFRPAKMDGKPVAVFTSVDVNFGVY